MIRVLPQKPAKPTLRMRTARNGPGKVSDDLLAALEGVTEPEAVMIRENKEFVAKKSVWGLWR